MLPESSSRPLPAALAQSRNLAHASLETAVVFIARKFQIRIVAATPKRRYATLLAALTSLVPAESALCLRAHLNRPPFVPFAVRNAAWSDYANLARTRIADLGQQMLRERQQHRGSGREVGDPGEVRT